MKEKKHYDCFDIAAELKQRRWIIPAYKMAPHAEEIVMLRVVCRQDFSKSRCEDREYRYTSHESLKHPTENLEADIARVTTNSHSRHPCSL